MNVNNFCANTINVHFLMNMQAKMGFGHGTFSLGTLLETLLGETTKNRR